jgi:hypothetical protein
MTGVPPKKAFSRTLAAESFGLRLDSESERNDI